MAEFRWILAALGVMLLVGIWAWGSRRSRQAPGNAEFREQAPLTPDAEPRGYAAPNPPAAERARPASRGDGRERHIAHLEPLDIRTANFDPVPEFDEPMSAHADPVDATIDLQYAATDVSTDAERIAAPACAPVAPAPPTPPTPPAPRTRQAPAAARTSAAAAPTHSPEKPAAGGAQAPNRADLQRIVSMRVCAAGDSRWQGQRLMSALDMLGLAFGRYDVFHRKHVDGRSLFCVASLVEPGVFDLARMPSEEFRGVTLFAVLPGPLDPVQTLNALFETAGGLAEELAGVVQDHKGVVMTQSSALALREEMLQFQTLLAS